MILPLINANGEHCWLNVEDIAYLQTNGQGKLHVYTYNETYRPISLLREWGVLLQKEGFLKIDRGTIVNARMIESVDPCLRVVVISRAGGAVSIPYSEKVRAELNGKHCAPSVADRCANKHDK